MVTNNGYLGLIAGAIECGEEVKEMTLSYDHKQMLEDLNLI